MSAEIADDLRVDLNSGIGLQRQIRQQLVEGIFSGRFHPGQRLPSSRCLAKRLRVARNTVLLAYQELIAEGHVVARARSGLYLSEALSKAQAGLVGVGAAADLKAPADWGKRLRRSAGIAGIKRHPRDWQSYPYVFIDGCFDQTLFPREEWRNTCRIAFSRSQMGQWSLDSGDGDDPELIEQIRTKILPRRGIVAQADEILVTAGTEPALHLLCELLVDADSTVGLEEPGHIIMREIVARRGARIIAQPVDDEGLIVDDRLAAAGLIYVTPSHQRPTAVTMSLARRLALLQRAGSQDALIIEDDVDSATNYLEQSAPALRSLPGGDRVIYVSDFSCVLAPAVRLGFMVAAAPIIASVRELRALIARHPPLSNQRTVALLLSLGHYDVAMLRLGRIFRERLFALREALNHYLQRFIAIAPARGGTTYWVRGPEGIDAGDLAKEAALRGILIEPVADYFAEANPQRNLFRMGVTGLRVDQVRPGVAALAEVLRDISARRQPSAGTAGRSWLSGEELKQRMPGAKILSKTVYGHPYSIELIADGRMLGRAGHSDEDRDEGRWWISGDRWFRQWRAWGYAEPAGYFVRLQGEHLLLFNARQQLVDGLKFVPGPGAGG